MHAVRISTVCMPRQQCEGTTRAAIWTKSGLVQDEMRQGLSYFHETIFSSLPVFQRRIDTALKNIGQPMLPLEHNLFHFGSWMGGDSEPFWPALPALVLPERLPKCPVKALV